MAISLKNIEDRVIALENLQQNNGKIEVLWSGYSKGSVTLVKSLWDYDLILTMGDYASKYLRITTLREVEDLKLEQSQIGYATFVHFPDKCGIYFKVDTSGKNLTVRNMDNTTMISVIGLKLYYNFSYNIIYKILSSIKFKISQIISSLKSKKEVKIMAISLKNHEDRIAILESFKSKIVTPDVSKRTEISSPYSVTTAGFVSMCTSEVWSAHCYFELNGVRLFSSESYGNGYYANINVLIPVNVGDKLTFKGTNSVSNGVKGVVYFYPPKVILYYFSNIIKTLKIILRIISKISHFFTKIFKYGGEIRDGYIC